MAPGLDKAFGCFNDEFGGERVSLYRLLDEHLRPQLPALVARFRGFQIGDGHV
jgi:hypothetical protein